MDALDRRAAAGARGQTQRAVGIRNDQRTAPNANCQTPEWAVPVALAQPQRTGWSPYTGSGTATGVGKPKRNPKGFYTYVKWLEVEAERYVLYTSYGFHPPGSPLQAWPPAAAQASIGHAHMTHELWRDRSAGNPMETVSEM